MSPVGRGGMGIVWHAHDVLLARDVAVKELILPYGLDQTGRQVAHRRVLREARSAARLTHPGIVTVHDVVEEDGRPWIVMELVRAWSLEQAVRQSGPLPVIQAAEIGIRVLDAVRHAHAAGILHRDIKPGNVLLTADRVILTDFGIAAIEGDVTITQTGLLMGSPAYIPPERLSGQSITQAADLWSFGATMYAAVEGRPPYEGPDPIAVLGAVLTQEPVEPQRAGALAPVIEGLLRKNPAERLTAEQVSDMLERVLHAHGSVRPRPAESARSLPTRTDSTPAELLPPLDSPPSGPMPSRIVETPSGPVRVPYDPLNSPSGGYSMPYDGLSTPSGSHRTDALPRADGFDAFTSPSGSHRIPEAGPGQSGAHPSLGGPPGPSVVRPFTGGQTGPLGGPPSRDFPSRDFSSHDYASQGFPSQDYASQDYASQDYGSQGFPPPDYPSGGPPSSPGFPPGGPPSSPGFASGGPLGAPPSSPSGAPPSFGSPSGSHQVPGDSPFGGPSGPRRGPESRDPFSSGPQPILPLTSDSRATPWPLASSDHLRDQAIDLSRDLTHNRLASLPTASQRLTKSRRRVEDDGGGWLRGGRPTPRLIVTAIAAVGAVVAVVLFVRTDGTPAPVPSAANTLQSQPPADDPLTATVPDGFGEQTPPGFSAAVPNGWKLTASGGDATFTGPKDSGMTTRVEQATPQPDGGLAELTREEADGRVDGYIQVQLQATRYRDWKAADWEYTYTLANGVPMHALTRYVTMDDTNAFKIIFTMPELKWDDQAETRKVFFDTFRQTT
ncbi:serine/threonine-protein kinase [Nonomuraea guangzhouensis]|uniref:non-specific serine/threonine protein kinase n=1 Tax=Nonomuraea guangzhouensis TaxID=1291555 RepID=A0ABW4G4X8_9ACTN|nr:serine/threonine-protein kinase [Nonomuraea guangzhouensis]